MYQILAKAKNGDWEVIENEVAEDEVNYLLAEYRLAFGTGWQFKIVKA